MTKTEAREELLSFITPGMTVWTILNRVSPSRTTRAISLKIIQDNNIRDITYLTACALGGEGRH